jgi:hypothetical protein
MNELVYIAHAEQVVQIITAFRALHGRNPDTMDVALHLDCSGHRARRILQALDGQGYVKRSALSARQHTWSIAETLDLTPGASTMNTTEQIRIVNELATQVIASVIVDIKVGHVPANWDGWELRQLVADRFTRQTRLAEDPKRLKAYKNTVLVNNL